MAAGWPAWGGTGFGWRWRSFGASAGAVAGARDGGVNHLSPHSNRYAVRTPSVAAVGGGRVMGSVLACLDPDLDHVEAWVVLVLDVCCGVLEEPKRHLLLWLCA